MDSNNIHRIPNPNSVFKTTEQIEIPYNRKMLNLPPEIIMEIIARLPVKCLLKMRCVSKSWRSLISSSQFVKTHLKSSINNPNLSNHRLLLTIYNPYFDLKCCSVNSLMFDPLTVAHSIDYPKNNPRSDVWVVGSCNGLICIAIDKKDVILWNPSTRISRKLPPVTFPLKQGFYYNWGFGYVEPDDDYKVVRIFCVFGNGGLCDTVDIYSLRSDSWKTIEAFKGGVPIEVSGKFASGRLHFPATRAIEGLKWNIGSLDLKSEVYGTFEQPNYGEGCFGSCLGVLGGCICVLCNYEEVRSEVWVLKEYGIMESWTKIVTIPYVGPCSSPFCMLPSGEVLLAKEAGLVVYNPRDNCFRHPEISNIGVFLEADIYVESLVSLQMQD